MENLLILGGDTLNQSDEGIGWYVAQLLAPRLPYTRIITATQLTADMARQLCHAAVAIFFDASAGGEPGLLHCEMLIPHNTTSDTSGSVTPNELLTLTHHRYGYCPTGMLLTLNGFSFDHSHAPSRILHRMMDDMANDAADLIMARMETAKIPLYLSAEKQVA